MASTGLQQPSYVLDPTRPVLVYIAAPLALLAFRLVTIPIAAKAPADVIADGVARLVWCALIPFLLASYASRVRQTRDWHTFSQWFGAWVLLYAVMYPLSNVFAVYEVFELAKRRVREPFQAHA